MTAMSPFEQREAIREAITMSGPWDHHKTLSEWVVWAERQAKDAHEELQRRLLSGLPEELTEAACELMNQLDGLVSDEWPCLTRQALIDAEPPEDDPGYCERPRREHGTYFTSNGMRAA